MNWKREMHLLETRRQFFGKGARGIGAGDVRLAAVVAMFLGYLGATYVFQGLALSFMLGGVVALLLLISRKANRNTRIAFGPYICIGAMAVVLFGV